MAMRIRALNPHVVIVHENHRRNKLENKYTDVWECMNHLIIQCRSGKSEIFGEMKSIIDSFSGFHNDSRSLY